MYNLLRVTLQIWHVNNPWMSLWIVANNVYDVEREFTDAVHWCWDQNFIFITFSVASTKSSARLDHKTPLTMFLKWALRVPVVWWYSITQLLLRISPLLSLNERESQGVSRLAVLSAVTHLTAENYILGWTTTILLVWQLSERHAVHIVEIMFTLIFYKTETFTTIISIFSTWETAGCFWAVDRVP